MSTGCIHRIRPLSLLAGIAVAVAILLGAAQGAAQERRAKVRISNAGFTITALPLLAANDWGLFNAAGLDVELIVMSPSIAAAALAQGDVDYVAGVGPASVAAALAGLPSRAIWFSSDRISYWLMAPPQYKNIESLKGKKIAISGGAGGTNHVALMIALEKSGMNPKDFTTVGIPGAQIQVFLSLESGFVDAALSRPRSLSARPKRAITESWTWARWWRCPAAASLPWSEPFSRDRPK